jgi:hypothetical protein
MWKFDWTAWARAAVICLCVVGGNVWTFSSTQQQRIDTERELQATVAELKTAVSGLVAENKELRDVIAKQNAYIQRVDQHSSDAVERLLRLETYTYGREMKTGRQ